MVGDARRASSASRSASQRPVLIQAIVWFVARSSTRAPPMEAVADHGIGGVARPTEIPSGRSVRNASAARHEGDRRSRIGGAGTSSQSRDAPCSLCHRQVKRLGRRVLAAVSAIKAAMSAFEGDIGEVPTSSRQEQRVTNLVIAAWNAGAFFRRSPGLEFGVTAASSRTARKARLSAVVGGARGVGEIGGIAFHDDGVAHRHFVDYRHAATLLDLDGRNEVLEDDAVWRRFGLRHGDALRSGKGRSSSPKSPLRGSSFSRDKVRFIGGLRGDLLVVAGEECGQRRIVVLALPARPPAWTPASSIGAVAPRAGQPVSASSRSASSAMSPFFRWSMSCAACSPTPSRTACRMRGLVTVVEVLPPKVGRQPASTRSSPVALVRRSAWRAACRACAATRRRRCAGSAACAERADAVADAMRQQRHPVGVVQPASQSYRASSPWPPPAQAAVTVLHRAGGRRRVLQLHRLRRKKTCFTPASMAPVACGS